MNGDETKANGESFNVQRLKSIGWISAAAAFVFLALSNFDVFANLFEGEGCPSYLESDYLLILGAVGLMIAGGTLYWVYKAKSAIVIAVAGLLGLLLFDWPVLKELILFAVYGGVAFNLKNTRIYRTVIVYVSALVVLHLCSCAFHCGFFIAALQLLLAACLVSRKYAAVEDIILKGNEYCFKGKDFIVKIFGILRERILMYVAKGGSAIRALGGKLLRLGGMLTKKGMPSSNPIPYKESDFKFCKCYAYSTFVVGLICCGVLIYWASPSEMEMGFGEQKIPWNQYMIVSAITQLMGCVLWGCFILSQISCAMKLRGRQIVAGTAPVYLLLARYLCLLLAAMAAVGVLVMLTGKHNVKQEEIEGVLYLTFVDLENLFSISSHCEIKTAVTLSSVAVIWHLLGSSNVFVLLRHNVAKIMSMEDKCGSNV